MRVDKVKAMAAGILGCARGSVWFDPKQIDKVKAVMTKEDIRGLISEGVARKRKPKFKSRGRARILLRKKRKGRKRGFGKRKGSKKARQEGKGQWIKNVRSQRKMLRELRKKKQKQVEKIGYRRLYKMVKGNFFKGKKYLKATVEGKK